MARLLVIDDDQRLRSLLERYLSEHDFEVSTVSDTREARACLKENVFDLLILDVMMPEESGFSFIEQ